jgi:hypothetical protein
MLKYIFIVTVFITILISCKPRKESKEFTDWKSKGDTLVLQTFDTLRNTLLKAISEKGYTGAVEFCNTAALNITSIYAGVGTQIKRTSDKIRNPANTPDEMENEMLKEYLDLKQGKKELSSIVKKDSCGNHHYFKPILIQSMCLNCHGEKETQIKPDTWDIIQRKFPRDAAINYKEGDLRGLWHITFSEKK